MTSRSGETRISDERLQELIAYYDMLITMMRGGAQIERTSLHDAADVLRELAATRREALQPVKNVTVTPAHWIPDEPKP